MRLENCEADPAGDSVLGVLPYWYGDVIKFFQQSHRPAPLTNYRIQHIMLVSRMAEFSSRMPQELKIALQTNSESFPLFPTPCWGLPITGFPAGDPTTTDEIPTT
jgi:hypothetical protein